jgi:myosin-1
LRQEGLDDMTLIARVNEDAILENLYKRFMKDIIYTNIGDVLVSMNPFYAIPGLYDDSVINDYCGKSRLELPPHIYAIAEQAYRSMMVDKENQCVSTLYLHMVAFFRLFMM